ncbi:hypothetical protein [Anabaena subtropica]|uniref:Secreted protein n=1 Tax=Anabaena subtropica FACHB-260 TaxID=2692884 RepID=A0ABR8CLL8_9NOST|nr:hypothetical protein [Anabaena subtropica]MBD2344131.1 hypothetical protein [Anabaena subtropica FACHB-260]
MVLCVKHLYLACSCALPHRHKTASRSVAQLQTSGDYLWRLTETVESLSPAFVYPPAIFKLSTPSRS